MPRCRFRGGRLANHCNFLHCRPSIQASKAWNSLSMRTSGVLRHPQTPAPRTPRARFSAAVLCSWSKSVVSVLVETRSFSSSVRIGVFCEAPCSDRLSGLGLTSYLLFSLLRRCEDRNGESERNHAGAKAHRLDTSYRFLLLDFWQRHASASVPMNPIQQQVDDRGSKNDAASDSRSPRVGGIS